MKQTIPLFLLFLGGSFLTLGDIVMKKWILNNKISIFVGGMIIYMIGLFFLVQSFKYKNIAVASTIFVIFNIITLSFVSWVYFKETLSPSQIAGIIFGILAIVFMEIT